MSTDYIQYIESFYDKEDYLKQYFEEIAPIDFYRYIFPVGSFERKGHQEDAKPNGILVGVSADETRQKRRKKVGPDGVEFDLVPVVRRKMVTDELSELEELFSEIAEEGPRCLDFYTMPAVSYVGLQRNLDNARYLHALVLDVDGLTEVGHLRDLVYQFEQDITPRPTFIVNSGHGVHLYFVFEDPIPLYPNHRKVLKELKYQLVRRIWNKYTSSDDQVQYQSIVQAFRVVGTLNKDGQWLRAYQTGDRCTVEDLAKYFPENPINTHGLDVPRRMTLHEAKQRYPEWYERKVIQNKPTKGWVVKRDLYDWWIRKIKAEAVEGHRYFSVMALAIYARKCNIPLEELEADAYSLIPYLDSLTNEKGRFTDEDVASALAAYQDRYITFPRRDIERITHISMPENKRNYQEAHVHLHADTWTNEKGRPRVNPCKQNRELALKYMREHGEISGRPSAESLVESWQAAFPDGKKADCIRDTGLSKPTVYKWWKKPLE